MMLEMYLSCNVRMSRWENFIYLWYSFATTSGWNSLSAIMSTGFLPVLNSP
jgi:hypothetical protein